MAEETILSWTLYALKDPWVIFGFAAQFIFFSRFVLQWYASEKEQRTVVPMGFWYLSVLGALMILLYAIERRDIVFVIGQAAALVIYARNIVIAKRFEKSAQVRTLHNNAHPS